MNIETKKGAVKFCDVITGSGSEVFAEADVILPDTYPDIMHILQIDTLAQIKEKDITNDKVILRGDVKMTILYIPDSQTDPAPVKSFDAVAHFTDVCQASEVTADMHIRCFASADSADYTLINNRKINVKTTVHTRFKASCCSETSFISDIEGDFPIEKKFGEFLPFRQESYGDFEVTVSDKIEFDEKNVSVGEILKVDATISCGSSKLLADKCVLKGIATINTVFLDSQRGEIEFYEHELPFTEVIDIPGIDDSMVAEADYVVSDIYYETDSSEDRISAMGVEVKLSVCVNVCGSGQETFLCDCYSPDCDILMTRKECGIDTLFAVVTPQITIKGDIFIDNEANPVARVCHISAKPTITSVTREDNLITVNGCLKVSAMYLTNELDCPLCTACGFIAFSHSLSADCDGDFAADCSVCLDSLSYTLPADNTISIRACTDATVKIIRNEKINIIDDISVSECSSERKSPIIIYFVKPGDTLWDVAKKYKTGTEKICSLNSLSSSSELSPGTKLLIPTS